MKTCTKCKIEKPLEAFSDLKKSKDGKSYSCKDCNNAQERIRFLTKNTPEYKAKKRADAKERYKNNPEKYREKGRQGWQKKKDDPEYKAAQAEYQKWYRQQDREQKLQDKRDYYAENREDMLATQKRNSQTPEGRAKRNARDKKRRDSNPFVRLGDNMRSRMSIGMREYKNFRKPNKFKLGIGCSWEDFIKHIESQFKDGMTWENYGKLGWHMDEKIPVTAWDFNNPEHFIACWHWTNRQPLFGKDNYKKGGVRTEEDQDKFDTLIAERLQNLRDSGVLQPNADPFIHVSTFK